MRSSISTCEIESGGQRDTRAWPGIDGTPVLDLRPYMQDFEPRKAIREPEWTHEIMKEYW